MVRILVSACLLGEPVRYDGGTAALDHPLLRRWKDEGRLVPVCPEVDGGLPVPRPPIEIAAGRAVTQDGGDVTARIEAGARRGMDLARSHNARLAILKDRSPSCGSTVIHDGGFSGAVVPGEGFAASLLRRHGIAVFSENELDRAAALLRQSAIEVDEQRRD